MQVKLIRMAAQKNAHTLGKGSAKIHTLLQLTSAFLKQVGAHMRATQSRALVCARLLLRGAGQSQHFSGDFHFAAVRVVRNIYQLLPVQVACLVIHPRISSRRILAQNTIKPDQRLDDHLPCSLSDLPEAADRTVQIMRSAGIVQQALTALRNLLEQYQLEDGNQRPQLRHVKDRSVLEGVYVLREACNIELISGDRKIVLSHSSNSGNDSAAETANLRMLLRYVRGSTSIRQLRLKHEKIAVQQQ